MVILAGMRSRKFEDFEKKVFIHIAIVKQCPVGKFSFSIIPYSPLKLCLAMVAILDF